MNEEIKKIALNLSRTLAKPEARLMQIHMIILPIIDWIILYLQEKDPDCPTVCTYLDGKPVENKTRIDDLIEAKEIINKMCAKNKFFEKQSEELANLFTLLSKSMGPIQ